MKNNAVVSNVPSFLTMEDNIIVSTVLAFLTVKDNAAVLSIFLSGSYLERF